MHSTNLRRVGGSVMLAVPSTLLHALDLHVGSKVGIGIEDGRIVVHKNVRPKYTWRNFLSSVTKTSQTKMKTVFGSMEIL